MAVAMMVDNPEGSQELYEQIRAHLGLDKPAGGIFHIAGLEGSAARPIESAKLKRPLALAMGAEGKGLRHLTRQTCDELVRLDLPGPIKSLNVSNACALALYAVSRPDEPWTKADRL